MKRGALRLGHRLACRLEPQKCLRQRAELVRARARAGAACVRLGGDALHLERKLRTLAVQLDGKAALERREAVAAPRLELGLGLGLGPGSGVGSGLGLGVGQG